MVNFQVVDAQTFQAKQNNQHIKEKLYIYPTPYKALHRYIPSKKKLLMAIDEYLILIY